MKNFSAKVAQKKRKIKVANRWFIKEIRIDGLRDFHVRVSRNGDGYETINWNCHGSTYQIANVLTQVFGEKSGWEGLTEEECDQLIATLLNTLETLGHEVVYE